MRVPRRIADLVKQKQDFIDKQRDRLIKSVADLQADLLNAILAELIPALDTKAGVILETENNYRLISTLDGIYKNYSKLTSQKVLSEVNGTFEGIRSDNYDFMSVNLNPSLVLKFKDVKEEAQRVTDLRFGLKGGKTYAGGFLDSVLKENSPQALKRLISKMVAL